MIKPKQIIQNSLQPLPVVFGGQDKIPVPPFLLRRRKIRRTKVCRKVSDDAARNLKWVLNESMAINDQNDRLWKLDPCVFVVKQSDFFV